MIALPDLVAEVVVTTPRKVLFASANHQAGLQADSTCHIVSTSSHTMRVRCPGFGVPRESWREKR